LPRHAAGTRSPVAVAPAALGASVTPEQMAALDTAKVAQIGTDETQAIETLERRIPRQRRVLAIAAAMLGGVALAAVLLASC
jgi:hypothetical protein